MKTQCGYCKKADLEKVAANEPWSTEHYACPLCFSTYSTTYSGDLHTFVSKDLKNEIDKNKIRN